MRITFLLRHAVSQMISYVKPKSATHLARVSGDRTRNLVGQVLRANGYFASTVGRSEALNREQDRNEEDRGKRLNKMRL
jgi:putative transposase